MKPQRAQTMVSTSRIDRTTQTSFCCCLRLFGPEALHGGLGWRCHGVISGGLGGDIVLGSSGEVLLFDDLWRRGTPTVLVDGLLGLGRGLLGVALNGLGSVSGLLVGKALDLCSLLAGDLSALLELGINSLLVLDVDEGSKVGDEGSDQSQAPERDELDEEVGDQGSEEGL